MFKIEPPQKCLIIFKNQHSINKFIHKFSFARKRTKCTKYAAHKYTRHCNLPLLQKEDISQAPLVTLALYFQ